jgi:LysM repeat protein
MFKKLTLAALVILVVALTSCTLPYSASSKPQVTPSPTERAFTDPMEQGNRMAIVEDIATGTAAALTAVAGGGTGTPVGGTPLTPSDQITFTPTPIIAGGITMTPSLTPIAVGGVTTVPTTPVATLPPPTAIVNRPGTYILQTNEFVFCIARRFNVDPDDILSLNGLVDSETVYAGMVLTMPQSGSFPGDRALRPHPATYVVTGNQDTNVYGVACQFGDVDPARIVQANPTLSLASVLTIGQSISIP